MDRRSANLALSLAALALGACAGPRPAEPATPTAPAVAKAAPRSGRPEIRYYEISAA